MVDPAERNRAAAPWEAAPRGLILADARGTILRANATLADWMEGTRPVGLRFVDLLTPAARATDESVLRPLLRSQGLFQEAV